MTFRHRRAWPKSPRRDGGRRSEAGESLVELLLAIALMGVAFAVVMAGLVVAIDTRRQNQTRTQVSRVLQKWAEDTLAPVLPVPGITAFNYAPCGEPPSGVPSGSALPSGWTAAWTIRYAQWSGSPPNVQLSWTNPSFNPGCAPYGGGGHTRDGGLQRITLRVTTAPGDRQVTDSLVILKRDPRCPTTFDNADQGPC